MLARQRQLIKQRNQTKAQASRQLPAKGESSAGSIKARGQRAATRVQQKVNQDVATVRALADNMQRNQAREARQIKPDPSPKTRFVGPEGANPRGQAALPPGQRGGEMRQRGGAIVRASKGAIRLADRQGQGAATPQSRRPSRPSGAIEKAGPTIDVTANSEKLPGGKRGGPLARDNAKGALERRSVASQTSPKGLNLKGRGTAAAVIAGLAEPAVAAVGQAAGRKLGEGLKAVGRRLDDMRPGINSKDEANRVRRATPLPQMTAQQRANAVRLENYNPPTRTQKASEAPQRPSQSQQRNESGTQPAPRRSAPSRSSAPSRQQASTKPSTVNQSAEKVSESSQVSGIGPVKDGQSYASKKLSIQETLRELREMRKRSQERQKQDK